MRIVHLSDMHFGTIVDDVLKACFDHIQILNPDLVVLSGDITQRALRREFTQAVTFLEQLNRPYLAIAGNHDIPLHLLWERFTKPYKRYQQFFAERFPVHHARCLTMVGVDATSRFRHTRGKVNIPLFHRQMETALKRHTPESFLGVAVHQPLETLWKKDNDEILINASEFASAVAIYNVDFVLTGHVHVPFVGLSQNSFHNLGSTFVMIGAGTATSHRVRSGIPNSFYSLDLGIHHDEKMMVIQRFDYNQGENCFFEKTQCRFDKLGHTWTEIKDV